MATTRGNPEPEPTREERAAYVVNEVIVGQGTVRTAVLYGLLFLFIVLSTYVPVMPFAVVAAALLVVSDPRLA